jgi:hypothetical protein
MPAPYGAATVYAVRYPDASQETDLASGFLETSMRREMLKLATTPVRG